MELDNWAINYPITRFLDYPMLRSALALVWQPHSSEVSVCGVHSLWLH